VGAGASGRNGGVLGSGQRKDQDELERWLGPDDARHMWQIACDANQLVRDRIAQYGIQCDLKDGELTVAHKERHAPELWEYAEHLDKTYGYTDMRAVDRQEAFDILGVDSFYGGYVDARAGHIHPFNLALGLASAAEKQGAQIYEQTRVTDYRQVADRVKVNTAHGTVTARFMIMACNGYLGRLEPGAERYQMPINNFILATEPLGEDRARSINRDDLAVVDTRFVVNYFHNSPDHRLIFGGGENYSSRFPSDIKKFVRKNMLEVYPQLADVRIDYAWGGTLAVTMRRMPHFGRKGHNVYWAQGYSGHGIAMANMGGKLVADAIMGQAERFDLFSNLDHLPFPGGRWLRWPGLVAGMLYYAMLDRI
jgi:gamma-glutamylputrescine oxidase